MYSMILPSILTSLVCTGSVHRMLIRVQFFNLVLLIVRKHIRASRRDDIILS
jgi:hypothetical protein